MRHIEYGNRRDFDLKLKDGFYEIGHGNSIQEGAVKLVEKARVTGQSVFLTFNGRHTEIRPEDNVEGIVERAHTNQELCPLYNEETMLSVIETHLRFMSMAARRMQRDPERDEPGRYARLVRNEKNSKMAEVRLGDDPRKILQKLL